MTAAEYIWHYLADCGVRHVFYLPGGGSMYLVDALIRQTRITPISMLHEQACGIAAEAYAQYTGGLGVACVTSGPGSTNIITPVAAAWIDSTPLLVVSGQVATHQMAKHGQRQGGPQEVCIVDIVDPIVKAVSQKPMLLPWLVETAFENPSGPVWLDVPLDVQTARI